MEGQFFCVVSPSLSPSSFSGDPTRSEQLSVEGMRSTPGLESNLANKWQGISTFSRWLHHRFNMRDLHRGRLSSRPQSAIGEPSDRRSEKV